MISFSDGFWLLIPSEVEQGLVYHVSALALLSEWRKAWSSSGGNPGIVLAYCSSAQEKPPWRYSVSYYKQ